MEDIGFPIVIGLILTLVFFVKLFEIARLLRQIRDRLNEKKAPE